jgi:hypothetical protein
MPNPNIFQNFDLPYEPLPLAAYEAARASILRRDFPQEGILDDYSFSSRSKEHTIKINALAFAHPVHRNPAEYASFTLYNAVNGQSDDVLVKILAESAAPFHLIHRDNQFYFWVSAYRNNQVEPIPVGSHIAYDQLDNVLSDYASDLNPRRIIDVKQGRDRFTIFHDIYPLQLSFWAADVTRDLLVDYFGQAVNKLRTRIRYERETPLSEEVDEVTDLAIQLLGAIILADTGVLGDDLRRRGDVSLNHLLTEAQSKFGLYFQKNLFEKYYEAAEEIYQLLRQIRYAGFVPDMLRDLYMKAYSEEERKESGSYDTPLYLTRRIWDNIPVEYLPPSQRIVVDMTCGWGSFLIAGHERLANLSDMPNQSLRNYLYGTDEKYFTARLAGLGLLLSTSEDSWHINHEDALSWRWLNAHQPNIIVGNPPFKGSRKESQIAEQRRYQKADIFLKRAIERLAPGGYLAMIMPRSFTAAEASPELRKHFLEACNVFELWELPTGVFLDVTVRTIVLFAQKRTRSSSHNPVRVRTIQPVTLRNFQHSGIFTASGLVIDQSAWNNKVYKLEHSENTHIMEYKLVLTEPVWRQIDEHCVKLQECAEVFRGATVGTGGTGKRKSAKRSLREYEDPKKVPWIRRAQGILKRPFFLDYKKTTTITYPNELQWPRLDKKHIFEDTKVLVVYGQDPSWGKRVKVAIERKGYYVSDSFWVIAPTPHAQKMYYITHEVLAAVVSWDVSNAWVIEHMKSPAIPEYAINTIPFPKNLGEDDCKALTEAVRKLEDAAFANKPAPAEATQTIDTILKAAYQLDDATFERLRKVSEWSSKPEMTLDVQPDREVTNCFISGVVDNVDAAQGTITLWIKGFDELQTVQIMSSMPGWLLRTDAEFYTQIPRKYVKQDHIDFDAVDWDTFRPQMYTYMSEVEILEDFTKLLQ